MNSVALVTGGAGFLGSALCERLLADGRKVVCLDNFSTGHETNVAHIRGPNFHLVCGDVVTSADYGNIVEIYNLACPASPVHYQKDPIGTLKTCVLGALNVLELARASDAKILQASTSEVYGSATEHPQPESYWGNVNPTGPRACYDEGKRAAEALFADYKRIHGTQTRVARIFNTYGPRMSIEDGRVISRFIVQALRGEDLTVFGDGEQTRSFCYVDDLVSGIVALMKSNETSPVNLGNPAEITMVGLARLVIDLTASSSSIAHRALPTDDPLRRRPDISKAREGIGWSPETDLRSGLTKTIAYYEALLSKGAVGPEATA